MKKGQHANWWPSHILFHPMAKPNKRHGSRYLWGRTQKLQPFGLSKAKGEEEYNLSLPIIICERKQQETASGSGGEAVYCPYLPDWWCGDEGPNSNLDLQEATPEYLMEGGTAPAGLERESRERGRHCKGEWPPVQGGDWRRLGTGS